MDQFLKNLIKEAGALAKSFFDQGLGAYTTKMDPDDILTEADTTVSDFIIQKIQAEYPDHYIFTEEAGEVVNKGAEYQWIVDPIDGTRNFAAGIPTWCILITLLHNEETIMAGMYNPVSDQLYFAKKGEGSYLNDRRIFVSKTPDIDYAFGHCSRSNRRSHQKEFANALVWLITKTKARIGNYGSMISTGSLAAGGMDFHITNGGVDHDYLGAILIAQEAGAVVTDCEGSPWQRGRNDLIIANPILHPKLLAAFKAANL